MITKKTAVGDIVLISLEQGFRPAKVLYVSQRYKDTILIGIYKAVVDALEFPNHLSDDFELLLYTSKVPIQKKRWHCVGNEPLRVNQKYLDLRVVAGDLWQGDKHLGRASDQNKQELLEMLVMGPVLVEKKAAQIK